MHLPLVLRYQSVIKSLLQPFAVAVENVIADTLGVTKRGPVDFDGSSLRRYAGRTCRSPAG